MPSNTTPSEPHSITTYVEDGARIAAILLVWGILAVFVSNVLGDVGGPGSLFDTYGPQLGSLFVLTGFLNAVLYVVYRGLDYR